MKLMLKFSSFALIVCLLFSCSKAAYRSLEKKNFPKQDCHIFLDQYPKSVYAPYVQERIDFYKLVFTKKGAVAGDITQIDSLKNFTKKYPESIFLDQVKAEIAMLDHYKYWKEVHNTNTLETYESFVKDYSTSPFVRIAKDSIDVLKELKVWEVALISNSIVKYKDYERSYPEGKFLAEARFKIKEATSVKGMWKKAKAGNTLQDYRGFERKLKDLIVDIHYNVRYFNSLIDSYERMRKIEEELDFSSPFYSTYLDSTETKIDHFDTLQWQGTRKKNTPAAYRMYLETFPDGIYRQHSLVRLLKLGAPDTKGFNKESLLVREQLIKEVDSVLLDDNKRFVSADFSSEADANLPKDSCQIKVTNSTGERIAVYFIGSDNNTFGMKINGNKVSFKEIPAGSYDVLVVSEKEGTLVFGKGLSGYRIRQNLLQRNRYSFKI